MARPAQTPFSQHVAAPVRKRTVLSKLAWHKHVVILVRISQLVYTRQFAHGVKVTLNVSHGTGPRTHPASWVRCCIAWGDGTNSSCAPGDCAGMAPQSASKPKADDRKAALLAPVGRGSGGVAAPPASRAKTDDDAAPAVRLGVSALAPLVSHTQMQHYGVGYPDASLVAVKDKARPAPQFLPLRASSWAVCALF